MKKNGILALVAAVTLAACGGSNTTGTGADAQSKQLQRNTKTAAASYQNVVESLYIAYFGRPADPSGLANFEARLQGDAAPTDVSDLVTAYSTNADVKTLIDAFGTSTESQNLYAGGTTSDFVTAVFQHVLGRAPAASGLSFWVNAIDSKQVTQGSAALSIMAGAFNNTSAQAAIDQQLINNRVTEAGYFSAQVSAQGTTSSYVGSGPAATARAMLANVTATTTLAAFQTDVAATVTGIGNPVNIGGSTAPFTGSFASLNNNPNGAIILDSAGNKFALDAATYTLVSLGSPNLSLTGYTVGPTTGYLLYNGNIVGYLGYISYGGQNVVGLYYTANGQMGQTQINVASGTYTAACGNACSSNSGTTTPVALQIADNQVGTGTVAAIGKTVTVNYTGWLFNPTASGYEGTQFDSSASHGTTFSFTLGAENVISGWDMGVIGMKVGGTRTLIIPSVLGYGSTAESGIPANSALVFSVQLVSVQ